MKELTIDLNDIRSSREQTKTLLENIQHKPGSRFNTEEESNRYYGFLGENMFKKYLEQEGITYETDNAIGRKDLYDFLIKDLSFDIKTSIWKTRPQKKHLAYINEQQAKQGSCERYFFVAIHLNKAYLLGGVKKQDLKTYETINESHTKVIKIPLAELKKLGELL